MTTQIDRADIEYIADILDGDPHPHYSGRGMYGEECVGVSVNGDPKMFELGYEIGSNDGMFGQNLVAALSNYRTDSLGRGTIIYWPKISLIDGGDWDDENDEDS